MKKQINKLCEDYDIFNIERHIFDYYIKLKKVDISNSNILKDYFTKFKLDNNLTLEVEKLKY